MDNDLTTAVEKLYLIFRHYKIDDFTKISCFDYGPTAEELASISKDIQEIPDEVLQSMEFYDSTWDSWGTKNEVGYFLPRLMQYIADDVSRINDMGMHSLFKYKLAGLFSYATRDWSREEKQSLYAFFTALLTQHLSRDIYVGGLIECTLALGFTTEYIFTCWKTDTQKRKQQHIQIIEYFEFGSMYLKNTENYQPFLQRLKGQFTLEELDEIYLKICSRRYAR